MNSGFIYLTDLPTGLRCYAYLISLPVQQQVDFTTKDTKGTKKEKHDPFSLFVSFVV